MKAMIAVLLMLASAGCGYSTGPFGTDPGRDASARTGALATDRESYSAGSGASLRLRNVYQHPIGYNLCTSALERQNGGSWQTAEYENERVCTMELRILQSGGTDTYDFHLDGRLPSGTYRFRTSIENMRAGTREHIVSNAFRIAR